MTFDPFNDNEIRGYLRNHAGINDPAIVRRLEHNAFAGNIVKALQLLKDAGDLNLEHVQKAHKTLFSDVYPWAGEDRSQNASDLNITKGAISFQMAPYVPHGVAHALDNGNDPAKFRADPGKVIGELAYAHPFLEGNGRTITAVVSELARRAYFHIAWPETNKPDYLTALTLELDEPNKGHLTNYLKPFIRDGQLGLEQSARTLAVLPGLSAPDIENNTTEQPVLTIVAGPNGSGKSSLTASGAFGVAKIIDPDAIARAISPNDPESAGRRAGKRALDERNDLLFKGKSFVVEATLSGQSTMNLIDKAKEQGFRIDLKFIGLSDVELAKARVAARIEAGGHSVPDEDIQQRFTRSLENLPIAISKSDNTTLFDNSDREPHRIVAKLSREQSSFIDAPEWASDAAFRSAQIDLGNASNVKELERSTERAFDAARAGGMSDQQLGREVENLERVQERRIKREGHDF